MKSSIFAIAAAVGLASLASAETPLSCSLDKHCPDSVPCCSQYGQCGVGAYCLGGCDPLSSFSLESCVPAPVCQNKKYTWKGTSEKGEPPKGVTPKQKYLGDASTTDWVMDGQAIAYEDTLLLTMGKDTVGTVLATSTYMWYGSVKAKFKTSRGRGVVTAFILLSDVKDEIDYEYVGVDLKTAQTNYYFQGVTRYDQGRNISLSDTFNNYHEYEIQWTPDTITWLIDGQVGRVKERKDTWNATANQWYYPQTPARVQISIWPGGLASNAKGTIDWAGGEIDWNGDDIKSNGYYYAQFESVEVKCYDADTAPGTNKGKSYTYKNKAGTNDTVVDGDKPTILKSLLGSGTNMTADYAKDTSSQSSAIAAVPGLTGAGPGTDGRRGDEEKNGDDSSNTPSQGASGGETVNVDGSEDTGANTGFQQGDQPDQTGEAGRKAVVVSAILAGLGLGMLGFL